MEKSTRSFGCISTITGFTPPLARRKLEQGSLWPYLLIKRVPIGHSGTEMARPQTHPTTVWEVFVCVCVCVGGGGGN